MDAIYCTVEAENGYSYGGMIDPSEHNAHGRLTRNANGSNFCEDCRCIVILFDEDIHHCSAHEDCKPLNLLFNFEGWRGCTIPGIVAWEVASMAESMDDVIFRLDMVDMLALAKEAAGDYAESFTWNGEELWVSDIVTDLYSSAISALECAGYYVDTDHDGFYCYEVVEVDA